VLGDIIHQSLSVEMGAVFEGQCRYLQDPLKSEGLGNSPSVDRSGPESTTSPFGVGSGSVFGEPDRMGGVIVTGTSG
jgi:hypothetical protein